jgi:hypothetical protein
MNTYKSGQWNVTCDVCSKKIKAEDAKQRWDGFIVCPDDYEQRHPMDFIRTRQDKISVPFTRPIPPEAFNLRLSIANEDIVSISDVCTVGIIPVFTQYVNDTVAISDSGHLFNLDYVDITYFASSYVGSDTPF